MQGNLCSLREDVFENGNLIEILQASSPYNVFGDSAYDSFIGSLRETTQGFINVSLIKTILLILLINSCECIIISLLPCIHCSDVPNSSTSFERVNQLRKALHKKTQ